MIRVTVELIPGGVGEPEHLGTAEIANDGTGDLTNGNYNVRLSKWGRPNQTWKRGRVEGFGRLDRGPWDLLFLALRDAVGKRNGGADNGR